MKDRVFIWGVLLWWVPMVLVCVWLIWVVVFDAFAVPPQSKEVEPEFAPYTIVTDGNEYRYIYPDGKTISYYSYASYREAAEVAGYFKGFQEKAERQSRPGYWKVATEEDGSGECVQ